MYNLALPHLLGIAKPIWPERGDVRGQIPLVHRIVALAASGEESVLPLALDSTAS